MCDFRVRELAHPNYSQRYSIQCVLPINLYNQQIFTFLWFWYVILIFLNLYSLFNWILNFISKQRRIFIKKRLKLLNKYQKLIYNKGDSTLRKAIKETLHDFNDVYLKLDGVFIIKLICILTSDVVGTQILHDLWKRRKMNNLQNNTNVKKNYQINDKLKKLQTINIKASITEESENEFDLEDNHSENYSTITSNQTITFPPSFDKQNECPTSRNNTKYKRVGFSIKQASLEENSDQAQNNDQTEVKLLKPIINNEKV